MHKFIRYIYKKLLSEETRLKIYKFRHPDHYINLRSQINESPKGDFSLLPFDQHHTIFVHITKTAGTSVARSMFNYLPYHYTAVEYRVIYGKKTFDTYFKFAFVRNPWDRLYSSFRYLKSGGWNKEDQQWADENLSEYDNFKDFVLTWLSQENIKKHIHFKPQCEFVCDNNNNILVDYIAYFESLNDEFNIISKKLGIDSELGSFNMNPGDSYKEVYNDEMIKVVREIYGNDINIFGYDFDKIIHRVENK